jgi:hypothetical protein
MLIAISSIPGKLSLYFIYIWWFRLLRPTQFVVQKQQDMESSALVQTHAQWQDALQKYRPTQGLR